MNSNSNTAAAPASNPPKKKKEKLSLFSIFDFRFSIFDFRFSIFSVPVAIFLFVFRFYICCDFFFFVILMWVVCCCGLKSPARTGYNLCPSQHPTHPALSTFVVSFYPVLFLLFVLLVPIDCFWLFDIAARSTISESW